jgi:methionyl-tRNA formyltransferase
MQMEKGLDTGAVYATWLRPLDGTEYADPLEIELGELAGKNISAALLDIIAGKLQAVPQDDSRATVCRKIKKEMGIIDWNKDAREIEAMVRAYTPWPGAVCMVKTPRGDTKAAIIKAKVREDLSGVPGQSLDCGRKEIIVACGKHALQILEIAPSGSKAMPAAAFRNGLRGEKAEFIPLI